MTLPIELYRLISEYAAECNILEVIPTLSEDECQFLLHLSHPMDYSHFVNLYELRLLQYRVPVDSFGITLRTLHIRYSRITILPALPPLLKSLTIIDVEITEIPTLPLSLVILIVMTNTITGLPHLPLCLKELTCIDCDLLSLPALPASLEILNFSYNRHIIFPPITHLIKLQTLSFKGINITHLPDVMHLPLTQLCISDNLITGVIQLPPTLQKLYFDNTTIQDIGLLPSTMKHLSCHNCYNLLRIINLPLDMKVLDTAVTLFADLPPIPFGMVKLRCTSKQHKSLITAKDSLVVIVIADNIVDLYKNC